MIPAVLGLLVLASLVACYFSSKYWHWAQVLLVEVLFLVALGFFVLSGEVLRIQNIYGKKYQTNAQAIEQEAPRVEALQSGSSDEMVISALEADEVPVVREEVADEEEPAPMLGVRELDHKLGLVTRTRGRVWRDVTGVGLDAETLTVTLGIEFPDPHGIEPDAILYAFEQGPASPAGQDGPQYIGEFRVVDAAPKQIKVQPATQLDQRSIDRLKNTRFPWVLYENMPVDQHPDGRLEIFAGATEEELEQMLPAESVDEYIRHGSEARPDDDEWHRTGYDPDSNTYRRPLRDYNYIFQEQSKRFIELQADRNALIEDNKQLAAALASARELQAMRQEEQRKLKQDLAGVTRDRKAIETHLAQLETQLANAQQLLKDLISQNSELAEQLKAQTTGSLGGAAPPDGRVTALPAAIR